METIRTISRARLEAAREAIALLWAWPVNYDDVEQTRRYYACADVVMAQVIATPAYDAWGCAVKAEAVAWACGSRRDLALGESLADRLLASLLGDLLTLGAAPQA